jgi:hypothetical protein
MAKTMKQMKSIIKRYLQKRVRLQRDVNTIIAANHAAIVAAHQAAIVVQQQAAIAAHQAALDHHAALQAQHDRVLQQAAEAHLNGDDDDEWLIAHEYENEEWEDGV